MFDLRFLSLPFNQAEIKMDLSTLGGSIFWHNCMSASCSSSKILQALQQVAACDKDCLSTLLQAMKLTCIFMLLSNLSCFTVLTNWALINLRIKWGQAAVCPWILNATSTLRAALKLNHPPCSQLSKLALLQPHFPYIYIYIYMYILLKSILNLQLHNILYLFKSLLSKYLWHKRWGSRERSICANEYVSY